MELYATALAYPEIPMFLDPFMDVDRGYFVRHGLIDRRCNLRSAGMAVEAMTAYLGGATARAKPFTLEVARDEHATQFTLSGGGMRALIVLPLAGTAVAVSAEARLGFSVPPLAVPLDLPWCVAAALGSDLAAADGRWLDAVSAPTLFIGAMP